MQAGLQKPATLNTGFQWMFDRIVLMTYQPLQPTPRNQELC